MSTGTRSQAKNAGEEDYVKTGKKGSTNNQGKKGPKAPADPPAQVLDASTASTSLTQGLDKLKQSGGTELSEMFSSAKKLVGDEMEMVPEELEKATFDEPLVMLAAPVETAAPPPLLAPPPPKAVKLVASTTMREQHPQVLSGAIGELFDLCQDEEPVMSALLAATRNMQIVPPGEIANKAAELQTLREQLAVAQRNITALRSQLESSKSYSKAITTGAIKTFMFEKSDGKAGKISPASLEKVLNYPDRVERVSTLLAGATDNPSFAAALRGYVQSLS